MKAQKKAAANAKSKKESATSLQKRKETYVANLPRVMLNGFPNVLGVTRDAEALREKQRVCASFLER